MIPCLMLAIFLVYGCISIGYWQFNPGKWTADTRGVWLVSSFCVAIVLTMVRFPDYRDLAFF